MTESNSGHAFYHAKIGDITDGIISLKYTGQINADTSNPVIGSTCAQSVEVTLTSALEPDVEYALSFGIVTGSAIEYKKLGLFTFEKPEINDGQYKYKGYDRMAYRFNSLYTTKLTGAHKTSEYMAEVAQLTGVSFVSKLDDIVITMLPGYTYREMIGYLAALHGANAIINDEGNLEFRWYTQRDYTPAHIYMSGITYGMTDDYTLNMVKCTVSTQTESGSEDVTYTSGSGSTGISISNPFMTQALLDGIYKKIGGLVYRPMTVSMFGDVLPELGDIINVSDGGRTYKCPIMQLSHEYDGGIKTEIVCVGSAQVSTVDSTGPITKAMDRYYADLVLINEAFVTKLTAQEAKIDKLDAEKITVSYLDAHFANLQLTNIEAGSIKTAMIDTGAVGTAQIADGSITDAKIVNLTANKLSAGTIDASKIEVTNLNCANLTVGTINGQQIASGAVDMSKLGSDMTSWISSTDGDVSKALSDAGIANTAAASASKKADNAVSIANGKNTAYYQISQPTGGTYKVNDNWFDTDDGYRMYYWNGSKWMATEYGASAIAASAITAEKIAASAITAGKIAAGAISSDKIAANAITADKIAANAITAGQIAAGTITATQIASKTITADNLHADCITSDKIVASAITADKIAANAITANKIAANAITADKLSVTSLSAISANLGAITSGSLNIGSGNFVVDTSGNLTSKGTMSIGNGGITYTAANGLSVFGDIKVKGALKMYYDDRTIGACDGKEHYYDAMKITIMAAAPYLDVMSIFTEHDATFNGGLSTAGALNAGALIVSGGSTLIGNVSINGVLYPNGGISGYAKSNHGHSSIANGSNWIQYDATNKRWAMYDANGKGYATFNGSTFSATNFSASNQAIVKQVIPAKDVTSGYSCGNSTHRWNNIYSRTATINTSDRNEKHDINYDFDVDIFNALKPCTYMYNVGDRVHYGFIAQDVEQLMIDNNLDYKELGFLCRDVKMRSVKSASGEETEVEMYNEDGSYQYTYGLRYEEIIAINTRMIQREMSRSDELRQKIQELESMIYNLQFEMARLQA